MGLRTTPATMAVAAATRPRLPLLDASAAPSRPRSTMSPTTRDQSHSVGRPSARMPTPLAISRMPNSGISVGWSCTPIMRDSGRWHRTSASPRPMLNQPRQRARLMPGAYCMSGGACEGAAPRVGVGAMIRDMDRLLCCNRGWGHGLGRDGNLAAAKSRAWVHPETMGKQDAAGPLNSAQRASARQSGRQRYNARTGGSHDASALL